MARMAAMGVPAGRGGNELDCRLRDELDHVGLLWERLRPPLWKGDLGDGRSDFSACTSRSCSGADLLVHAVLDVPPEDFLKDLNPDQACLRHPARHVGDWLLGNLHRATPSVIFSSFRGRSTLTWAHDLPLRFTHV